MDSSARWRLIGWYGLLVGTLLRFLSLARWPLWCDELASLQRTMLPLTEHLKLLSKRPPFFELMLRLWTQPQTTDVVLRIPSAAFGTVALWVVWRLARSVTGEKAAAIAAWLLALSPLHLMFSRIARSYSLAAMLASLSIFAVWKIYAGGQRRWWLLHSLSTILALYTDSLMCALVLAQNVFMFAMLWRERPRLMKWIIAQVLLGALFAPWVVLSFVGTAAFARAVPYTAHQFGPAAKAAYLAFALCVGETISPLNLWAVVPAFLGFFGAFLFGLRRLLRQERNVAWFIVPPLAFAFGTGLYFAAASPKHLSVMLPLLVLVLAIGVAWTRPSWLGWVLAVLIFGPTIFSAVNYFEGREFADASMATPWREIAAVVKAREKPGGTILIGWRTRTEQFGSDKALLARYYDGKCTVAYLPPEDWKGAVKAEVEGHGEVWLLFHRDEPRGEIEAWLVQAGYEVAPFAFQYDEETLRRMKEGGPSEKYRSFLYKLYLVQPSSDRDKPRGP